MKKILAHGLLIFLAVYAPEILAAPQSLAQQLYQVNDEQWRYHGQELGNDPLLQAVDEVALTGGHYLWAAQFEVGEAGRYVLDFSNTSVIAHFEHTLYNEQGQVVATLKGGLLDAGDNPFLLRHGRELFLPSGHYSLLSSMQSAFYLAQPQPYLDTLEHYHTSIKRGNALVLICFGVFIGLGLYYFTLGLARRRLADLMYAFFILGNFLYNGTALLVFHDLLGAQTLYLLSYPIVFSNMAYVVFVMSLLNIGADKHPWLYRMGQGMLGLLGLFLLIALLWPNWSLEMARYGVGAFLLYGMVAGVGRAKQGNTSARVYLIAIFSFFVLGGTAISLGGLVGVYTIYMEHIGIVAVVIEVLLLALVLAYQYAQLQREKEHYQQHMQSSQRMAYTDALTGLPNRYAMDKALTDAQGQGSLTFIDLDRLKFYNDNFGHARGDALLCSFASELSAQLNSKANIFRVGGDEFAIVCPSGDVAMIETAIENTIQQLRKNDFELAGASYGSALFREKETVSDLKHLADMRMYEHKHQQSNAQPVS